MSISTLCKFNLNQTHITRPKSMINKPCNHTMEWNTSCGKQMNPWKFNYPTMSKMKTTKENKHVLIYGIFRAFYKSQAHCSNLVAVKQLNTQFNSSCQNTSLPLPVRVCFQRSSESIQRHQSILTDFQTTQSLRRDTIKL